MSAPGTPDGAASAYEERLRAFAGRELTPRTRAQDPVNQPMIRHWTEAMGDTDPVHTDAAAARATGRADVTAPASMVQAWTMRGYAASQGATAVRTGFTELVDLLAEGGYTSVVATDSELEFVRELHPGDHIEVREVCESVSEEKRTALGTGRFVTTVKTYSDQHGESVATQRWRTLRFRPAEREGKREEPREGEGEREEKQRAPRPRPAINRDNAFWFEAAREHRLVVQRCAACATLRHPPGPCCPECGALEWDTVEASGHGHVHTFVVNHHPPHPAFDTPYIVAVVELAESTRLITNLTGIAPGDVRIGMPVVLEWLDADAATGTRAGTRTAAPGSPLTLPVFRPAAATEER